MGRPCFGTLVLACSLVLSGHDGGVPASARQPRQPRQAGEDGPVGVRRLVGAAPVFDRDGARSTRHRDGVATGPAAQAVPLHRVRLLPGPLKDRQDLHRGVILGYDPERLLHNFRVNAGLPSSARPYGGWEAPAVGLRGHFTGHYVSACALMYAATGEARFKARVDSMVTALGQVQRALGGGYLSAFPSSVFDTLERTPFEGVWAPYYTIHKIMAGLIDAYHVPGRSGTPVGDARVTASSRRSAAGPALPRGHPARHGWPTHCGLRALLRTAPPAVFDLLAGSGYGTALMLVRPASGCSLQATPALRWGTLLRHLTRREETSALGAALRRDMAAGRSP